MRGGQCARTSPCAHVRHMARRLALLALLACAVFAHRPPSRRARNTEADSESLDPFVIFDDYDYSQDTSPQPRVRTTTPSSKVILRGKPKYPKVNVTVKTAKGEDKKVIKTTNINIESHTNFIVTKPPLMNPNSVTKSPQVHVGDQYVLVESPEVEYVTRKTTKKPATSRRPSTRRPTTRRPSTRRPSTTRRPTPRPVRTKAPPTRKTTCPSKNTGWLSTFFQNNKLKKNSKKPAKSG